MPACPTPPSCSCGCFQWPVKMSVEIMGLDQVFLTHLHKTLPQKMAPSCNVRELVFVNIYVRRELLVTANALKLLRKAQEMSEAARSNH